MLYNDKVDNFDKTVGYCSYCHGHICDSDDYVNLKGELYHLECSQQMNTCYDPFDIEE